MIDARHLLPRFFQAYPFQPATAIWRAVEVAALLRQGIPEGRGLDVGCGDGLLTQIIDEYLSESRTWVGVDPDQDEVELARLTGLYSECHVAGGSKLPFESSSFDFALSNSVLEHIADLSPVLVEVSRVLKPGGCFLITVPSDTFHASLRGPILPYANRAKYLELIDKRCAHIHYWSADTWRQELSKAGLSMVSATPYLDREEARRWESCSRFTGGILYSLFHGRQQPIQIQRKLGIRRHGWNTPLPIARFASWALGGILNSRNELPPHACLLIISTKI